MALTIDRGVVRGKMMAHWIVICGASSTGKTTLAEDWLKKHREYAYLEEVARGVMDKNSIMREDVDASLENRSKRSPHSFGDPDL